VDKVADGFCPRRLNKMPAEDFYHQTVVAALEKAGWYVVRRQPRLQLAERWLWIDMIVGRDDERIYMEVKGFEVGAQIEYLAAAIGKYLLYRAVLDETNITIPLYMAVPHQAYEGILSEPIGRLAIQKTQLKLVVFDPVKMEVIRWET
jgi:hypothetical protein